MTPPTSTPRITSADLDGLRFTPTPSGVRLNVRVTPRASRTGVDGARDGRLLVRVTAAPVDDAANEAVLEMMAAAFDVPKRSVRIVSGATSRNKAVEIAGLDAGRARRRLEQQ